jgi:hypothetical protein
MWFASGIVLHFVGFPSLSADEQWEHAEQIDAARIQISPRQALDRAAVEGVDDIRLRSFSAEPTYLVTSSDRAVAISAVSGERVSMRDATFAKAAAERFGNASAVSVQGPFDYDQWVVYQDFDRARPFFKVRLNDSQATDLYVSARTGEVLQRTRFSERAWNWCGAVLHWIYFTPVRKDWSLWNELVWWVSLVAMITSVIGAWLGVVRMLGVRSTGKKAWSPFRRWLRWHHVIGLMAGLFVLTWIFSGWLSMDHGRLFSRGGVKPEQVLALRGVGWSSLADEVTLERIRQGGAASDISLNAVASRAFLTVHAPGHAARTIWLDRGETTEGSLPPGLLREGLLRIWKTVTPVQGSGGSEGLYRLAESVSPGAFAIEGPGDNARRVYLDPDTGRFLAIMDSSRLAYAWFYYGLHTFNFPGLNVHPLTRTIVVVSLALFGLVFSVTGLVLALRRIQLELRKANSN